MTGRFPARRRSKISEKRPRCLPRGSANSESRSTWRVPGSRGSKGPAARGPFVEAGRFLASRAAQLSPRAFPRLTGLRPAGLIGAIAPFPRDKRGLREQQASPPRLRSPRAERSPPGLNQLVRKAACVGGAPPGGARLKIARLAPAAPPTPTDKALCSRPPPGHYCTLGASPAHCRPLPRRDKVVGLARSCGRG